MPFGNHPGYALIFDMDGVIVDSNPAHRETWTAFNRRFGLETSDEMQRFMYGRRNDEIVRHFYGDGLSAEEVIRRGADKERLFREIMAGRVEEILAPGLREFLARHGEAPMAVASNAEPANIDFVLDGAGLRERFRVVVDGNQARRPKPFPDIYLKAAELLRVPPEACIVFEDSLSGVAAARAAGMRVVGVRTTYRELPGTELAVDDFRSEELDEWLRRQELGI